MFSVVMGDLFTKILRVLAQKDSLIAISFGTKFRVKMWTSSRNIDSSSFSVLKYARLGVFYSFWN